jgi:predicted ABC-type sugar transport system permease subunit
MRWKDEPHVRGCGPVRLYAANGAQLGRPKELDAIAATILAGASVVGLLLLGAFDV